MWKFTNEYVPNNTHGKINEFSRNNISPLTRPRWPFAVVGSQQDAHERRQDEMSLSDRETPYKKDRRWFIKFSSWELRYRTDG